MNRDVLYSMFTGFHRRSVVQSSCQLYAHEIDAPCRACAGSVPSSIDRLSPPRPAWIDVVEGARAAGP
jgi:hypothetical protein